MQISWHLVLMATLYILAGLNHFRKPKLYLRIIPTYIPFPKTVNYLSGFLEVLFGIGLLIPETKTYSAWAIIVLLIAVFPANMFMLTDKHASFGLPKWLLILRLPMQIVLLIWAYLYTR